MIIFQWHPRFQAQFASSISNKQSIHPRFQPRVSRTISVFLAPLTTKGGRWSLAYSSETCLFISLNPIIPAVADSILGCGGFVEVNFCSRAFEFVLLIPLCLKIMVSINWFLISACCHKSKTASSVSKFKQLYSMVTGTALSLPSSMLFCILQSTPERYVRLVIIVFYCQTGGKHTHLW